MSKNQLVILRREYLELTGDYCAAKLLAVFEHWSEFSLGEWIYMSLEQIHQELLGEYSKPTIRRAIARLQELDLLERRAHPSQKWNHTHQYRLDLKALHTRREKICSSMNKNLPFDEQKPDPSMSKKLPNNITVTNTVTNNQSGAVQNFWRLKSEWERFPSWHTTIAEEIAAHPEWQLHIVNDAIEMKSA